MDGVCVCLCVCVSWWWWWVGGWWWWEFDFVGGMSWEGWTHNVQQGVIGARVTSNMGLVEDGFMGLRAI